MTFDYIFYLKLAFLCRKKVWMGVSCPKWRKRKTRKNMKNKLMLLTSAITLVLLETVEERLNEIYPQYLIYTL